MTTADAARRRRTREKVSLVALVVIAVAFGIPYMVAKSHESDVHTVTYEVTGTAASTITEHTPGGQQQVVDRPLPWTDTFSAKAGAVLVVSAQSAGDGVIGCSITVDGTEVTSSTSSGASAVVSCDGTVG